ncbi:MAG TPA: tetratricopeptide repeat protein [Ktedonobacterales bacterium]
MGEMTLGESLRKAEAEIAAGRLEQALAAAQDLQVQFPRVVAVQRVLGEVYLALRKPREAVAALDRAIIGDPEDARALAARAIVHQMHGDSMAALQWYRRACDVRPDDKVLRSTYAELAAHLGQPPYRPTRAGLARLYGRADLHAHAVREWEALYAEDPDQLEVRLGLAEALWRAGRSAEAEDLCQRINGNSPSCVKAVLLRAVLLHDRGEREEAQRLAARAIELDPDMRLAQSLLADRLAMGDVALEAMLGGGEYVTARPGLHRPLAGTRVTSTRLSEAQITAMAARPLSSMDLSSTVAPDVRTLFSETEFMLWGPEEEARQRAGAGLPPRPPAAPMPPQQLPTQQMPTQPRPAAPPMMPMGPLSPSIMQQGTGFAPPAPMLAPGFVPPVLVEQGSHLTEAESRAAMGWVQWLKHMGARAHGDTGASIPAMPTTLPGVVPGQHIRRATGPLNERDTEALKAMFAELNPSASGVRRVQARETEAERLMAARALSRDPSAQAPRGQATIEELDRAASTNGFQPADAHSGLLASLTQGKPLPDAPAAPLTPPRPRADDYPALLALARKRREEGHYAEALAEHHVLIKMAPELVPDVLAELRALAAAAPEMPEVHRALGDAHIKLGDYLAALESYNRAVALGQDQDD